MARYLVRLRGENFLLNLDGQHGKFGFDARRVVNAGSQEEAERTSIILIHQQLNQNQQIVRNAPGTPKVLISSIKKLGLLSFTSQRRNGEFSFFSEDDHPDDSEPR